LGVLVRILLFLVAAPLLMAERVLVSLPAGQAPPTAGRIGGKEVALRAVPAAMENAPTVVVLADWIEAEDRPRLSGFLRQMLAELPRKEQMTVVVVRGSELLPMAPVKTFAALEKELEWALEGGSAGGEARIAAEALFDLLLSTAPEPNEKWREWVWAGRLPQLPEPFLGQYLRARLVRVAGQVRARLSVWPPQEPEWPILPPQRAGSRLYEMEWETGECEEGFELARLEAETHEWPVLLTAPGFRPPSLQDLSGLLRSAVDAKQDGAGAGELERLRKALQAYPNSMAALQAGLALAEKLDDAENAAFFLSRLWRKNPEDAALLRRYAMAAYRSRSPEAESLLRRARTAMPRDAEVLERLGRLRLAEGDGQEAYALFSESLEAQPENITLWWIAADLARTLNNETAERRALRQALNREPGRIDRRARLLSLALKAGETAEARQALEEVWDKPPDEAPLLGQLAAAWEELGEPDRAFVLWQRAAGVEESFEKAHLALARILADRSDWAGSLKASERGLNSVPKSAGLHLARARALERSGRWQDARRALREAAEAIPEAEVLRTRAETERLFGGPEAWKAWERFYSALPEQGPLAAERPKALRNTIVAALQQGAAEVASRLLQLPEAPAGNTAAGGRDRGVLIPGGIRLLSYITDIGGPGDPGEYLQSFARSVAQRSMFLPENRWEKQVQPWMEHYERLLEIRKMFPLTHEGTTVVLSAGTHKDRQRTQQVLALLGYRFRVSRDRIRIEPQTKGERAKRQTLAAALDLDDREMEKALSEGRKYEFRIVDDFAPVPLGEKAWETAMKRRVNPMGFAGMLLLEPRLALVYAGLASAGETAAQALAAQFGIDRLAGDFSMLLFLYGPAMALDSQGRCAAPGGEAAERIWGSLAGESPRNGARFLAATLRKDGGMLLAWFSALQGTSPERQRWFIENPQRARTFYELMKASPEWDGSAAKMVRRSPLLTLIRELPLEDDGSLRFPGGAQVWQVAKGTSGLSRISSLEKRAQKAKPAEEERLLEQIARQRYTVDQYRFSQLENFLMAARVEDAFGRRLEPKEALILSQQFARYEWAFPLILGLPALGETELLSFFAWAESLDGLQVEALNFQVGLVGHLAVLEGLLVRSGRLEGAEASRILDALCRQMRGVEDFAVMGEAASKALSAIGAAIGVQPGAIQQAIEEALFGPEESLLGARGRKAYRAVQALQKTPPLDLILQTLEAARRGAEGASEAKAAAAALEQTVPKLEIVPVPKSMKLPPRLKSIQELWQTREALEIAREMKQKAARRKPNPKDFSRLSREVFRVLAPWLELSLRGAVAGFYLRPADLPVSEDPWLLRKYGYAAIGEGPKQAFAMPEFRVESTGPGSLPVGSPGGLPDVAGRIAVAGQRSSSGFAEALETRQVAGLRNTLFHRLREIDLRAVRLAVLAGREWVVEASFDANEASLLEDQAEGLLSPERLGSLQRLLARLRNVHSVVATSKPFRNEYEAVWSSVWENLSVSDLFWLGLKRKQGGEESALWQSLREIPADVWRGPLHELAPLQLEHARSITPRIRPFPPYEYYAHELLPDRLAERLAEFPLSLACAVDEAGLPPAALGATAERLARQFLAGLVMSDMADFRSAIALWKKVRVEDVLNAWGEEGKREP
jgi:tetratricopeptide (TPR) repeat protein